MESLNCSAAKSSSVRYRVQTRLRMLAVVGGTRGPTRFHPLWFSKAMLQLVSSRLRTPWLRLVSVRRISWRTLSLGLANEGRVHSNVSMPLTAFGGGIR
jgi:hypothetical protein